MLAPWITKIFGIEHPRRERRPVPIAKDWLLSGRSRPCHIVRTKPKRAAARVSTVFAVGMLRSFVNDLYRGIASSLPIARHSSVRGDPGGSLSGRDIDA